MRKKNNILIIGNRGFIGSNLYNKLNKKNNNIYLISKNFNKKDKKKNEFKFDVFKNFEWFSLLKNNMTVYFLAFNNDLYSLENNKGYINKIKKFCLKFNEYVIKKKIKINFIFTSTVTIYGITFKNKIVSEKSKDNPTSIYDSSKFLFEKIFINYSKKNYVKFISLRLSNVYGYNVLKKQINRGFLNKIVLLSIQNKKFNIFGSGKKLRNYIYVDDVVSSLIICSKKINKLNKNIYIVCGNKSYSFIDIINKLKMLLKRKINFSKIKKPKNIHPIENRSFIGKNDLFKKNTGWTPKIEIESGIKKIIKQTYKIY